ncbi:MAG: hypothetical protein CW342_03450 [Thermoactinomycetaceae bacterium]|nr:hypothetical protein [Thermoactinomycetaceae bacterium]
MIPPTAGSITFAAHDEFLEFPGFRTVSLPGRWMGDGYGVTAGASVLTPEFPRLICTKKPGRSRRIAR